jgi:two-component system OmpR family response regulator
MIKSAPGSPSLRCKVLLVEDDEQTLTLYASALRLEGFQVRTASDGLHALRIVESFEPDVVILDLRLPMASGFEVLRDMRATQCRMPVIAVSGHESGVEMAKRDPDFFAALQKPFDPVDLITLTRRALYQSSLGA